MPWSCIVSSSSSSSSCIILSSLAINQTKTQMHFNPRQESCAKTLRDSHLHQSLLMAQSFIGKCTTHLPFTVTSNNDQLCDTYEAAHLWAWLFSGWHRRAHDRNKEWSSSDGRSNDDWAKALELVVVEMSREDCACIIQQIWSALPLNGKPPISLYYAQKSLPVKQCPLHCDFDLWYKLQWKQMTLSARLDCSLQSLDRHSGIHHFQLSHDCGIRPCCRTFSTWSQYDKIVSENVVMSDTQSKRTACSCTPKTC